MAAGFVIHHTAGTDKTAGTATVAATLAANVVTGNTLVLFVACDNQSLTTPVVSSISKPGGETASWTKLEGATASGVTALSSVLGEVWAIKTTQQWNTASTVTVTLDTNTTAKVVLLSEYSGINVVEVSTSGTASSTTNDASASTLITAPVSGSLVIGFTASENSIQATADTDTLNGSWSTISGANTSGSTNISNVSAVTQYKIITADGHQTYNPPLPANDSIAMIVALEAASSGVNITLTPATETDTAVAITATKARDLSAATETNTAVAVTAGKSRTLTPATESDSAQAVTTAVASSTTAGGLVYHLNRKAGTLVNDVPTLGEAGAANVWAGTTGLSTVGALNVKALNALSDYRELSGVANQLAGRTDPSTFTGIDQAASEW